MKPLFVLLFSLTTLWQVTFCQSASVDKVEFFKDTSILNTSIVTHTGKLLGSNKKKGLTLPATITTTLADGTPVNEPVLLEVRGNFRRGYCYLPPIKVIFTANENSKVYPGKSLKLVNECFTTNTNQQYIFKEFLIYKIYNLLTDKSFRVRLLNVNFKDSSGKKKTITEHAFFMEDVKDLAKRNNCKEWKKGKLGSESTDRRQMTMVAIFEYMIGNTDWAVSAGHNTNLIYYKDDSLARPLVVPYDFDYSGLVNTDYAIPDEKLGIDNVRQRLYRGFSRTMDELNEVLTIFKQKKEKMYALIKGFSLLDSNSKYDMIKYLDEFFDTINRPSSVREAFIANARTN